MAKELTIQSKAANSKKNTVKKDENGYYLVNLGAFNTYNSAGQYYRCTMDTLKKLQTQDSILGRRIINGVLRSEYKHPLYEECKGLMDIKRKSACILRRAMLIDLNRVCAHIKSVNFNITNQTEPGWPDDPIIIVSGWVKPILPFKQELLGALENPDENVTFSIRAFVKETLKGTTLVKHVNDISTWDYVFEPGVKIASQWNAVGMEHRESCDVCINGICSNVLKEVLVSSEHIGKADAENIISEMFEEDKDILSKW